MCPMFVLYLYTKLEVTMAHIIIFVYQVRERLHLCAMFVHSNPSPFGFSSVGLFRGHCHKHSIHCCHLQKVNANLTANIIIFLQSFVQIFNAVSHL